MVAERVPYSETEYSTLPATAPRVATSPRAWRWTKERFWRLKRN